MSFCEERWVPHLPLATSVQGVAPLAEGWPSHIPPALGYSCHAPITGRGYGFPDEG